MAIATVIMMVNVKSNDYDSSDDNDDDLRSSESRTNQSIVAVPSWTSPIL